MEQLLNLDDNKTDINKNEDIKTENLNFSFTYTKLLSSLKSKAEILHQIIQTFHSKFESFRNHFSKHNIMKSQLAPQLILQIDQQARVDMQQLDSQKTMHIQELVEVLCDYDKAQAQVINELQIWKRKQAFAGNGQTFENNLNDIQNCFESLIQIICVIIGMARILNLTDSSNDVSNKLTNIIMHARYQQQVLVFSSFMIENQPPQVLKTHTKFGATVRWLIGPQLGIHMHNIEVNCNILSEKQAQQFGQISCDFTLWSSAPPATGTLENNIANMEYNEKTRQFCAHFRNISLKKINRSEKRSSASVMDEKFTLLFYTSCFLDDHKIHAWCLSLPIVVIVHNNQESHSWATITWDNAFSCLPRKPFEVPEQVTWSQLSHALNVKFNAETGRALTNDNLNHIYYKLFRKSSPIEDKATIAWTQLCKQQMQYRTFTFWDWFYAIMKLVKDNVQGMWQKDLLVGFIDKQKAVEILSTKINGAFLLRFSESKLGSISIALKHKNQLIMLEPWSLKDLLARSLVNRILDLPILTDIYPVNINKVDAFSGLPAQSNNFTKAIDGDYVRSFLRTCIPDFHEETPQQIQIMETDDTQNSKVFNTTIGFSIFEDFGDYFTSPAIDDVYYDLQQLSHEF